jgi:hypothetical protein
MAADLFERLAKNRPKPTNKVQEISPAQKLLTWLQSWPRDEICLQQIQQRGPRAVRATRRDIMESTEV